MVLRTDATVVLLEVARRGHRCSVPRRLWVSTTSWSPAGWPPERELDGTVVVRLLKGAG
jgi:hypothetical protein